MLPAKQYYDDAGSKYRYNPEQMKAICLRTEEGGIYKHSKTGDIFLKTDGVLTLVDTRDGKLYHEQAVVVVRDVSISMGGQERDLDAATNDLTKELRQLDAQVKLGVVDFSSEAKVSNPLTSASKIKVARARVVGGTSFYHGLQLANEVLQQHESSLRPIVLFFSDGGNNGCSFDSEVALLKEKADLVTVAFGESADKDTLRVIATSPDHFFECYDAQALRWLFKAVGQAVTEATEQGVSATQVLAALDVPQGLRRC